MVTPSSRGRAFSLTHTKPPKRLDVLEPRAIAPTRVLSRRVLRMPKYRREVSYGGLVWTHEPDGEYGQYSTDYRGRHLTVSTNYEGDDWDYCIDDGDLRRADIDTLQGAMQTAIDDVDGK